MKTKFSSRIQCSLGGIIPKHPCQQQWGGQSLFITISASLLFFLDAPRLKLERKQRRGRVALCTCRFLPSTSNCSNFTEIHEEAVTYRHDCHPVICIGTAMADCQVRRSQNSCVLSAATTRTMLCQTLGQHMEMSPCFRLWPRPCSSLGQPGAVAPLTYTALNGISC